MKTEPPLGRPTPPPWHLLQAAAQQFKARQAHLLTFALGPWTWSGRLPGDPGSCFGQGEPVLRRLGDATEQGAVAELTGGGPAREAAQVPLICSGDGRPQ